MRLPVFSTAKRIVVAMGCLIASTGVSAGAQLPRVLIIGDHGWGERSGAEASGYTEAVRELLAGKAEVSRSPDSGATTAKALKNLDAWLGQENWDVIYFSFGLHDLKTDGHGRHAVPLEEYERHLEQIIERLKRTGATLVWATTTPVQPGNDRRTPEDVVRYNAASRKLIDRSGIPTSDLYNIALPHLAQWQLAGSPHFSKQGAKELARHVVAAINKALDRKSNTSGIPSEQR